MRKLLIIALLLFIVVACSEKDNYSAPNKTLQGAIIDRETGDSIPSQSPNGLRVRLYDQGYQDPQPIDFWGMQDGSFKNTKLFGGDYKVVVDNGGFYSEDTLAVSLPKNEPLNIEVLPILRIRANAKAGEDNSIIVDYELSETKPEEGKIMRRSTLVSNTPYVDINNFVNSNPFINTESVSDSLITTTTYRDTIRGLESNTTYFVRIGARTDNVGNRYNYSEVMEIELP
ncbi:Protein of unknown function [Salegentibacter echinorum]|uniref:DUF3823 domain-containing protein n=1 Tax=Salegentibacter echinorum TaxID=1073325 RepID=A0A1M5EAF2_SALEC|nr:DUF3823 domain-containing protein [Salegentibacter echinorum]SHF76175.1 Protein of unknown function [Salegentibacter echinorum]